MTRVALLTEIPAPYRIPLFNALARRLDLHIVFLAERNPERPYRLHAEEFRFASETLRGRDVTVRGRWVVLNRRVTSTLRGLAPDVVAIGGWNQPAFLVAAAWAKARRVPLVAWVESTGRDRRSGRLETPKRRLLATVDAFVVPGRAAHAYLEQLGVAPERIVVAPNAVDPTVFAAAAAQPADGERRPVVLAVGRLASEKGVDVLLRAARDLPVDVVLAGTGPEEPRLRTLAGPNVRFVGHVDRDELPALYAAADVVAMPSRSDPWGMVLNEAALAGRPLVSTDAAGAAHELIEDGGNGYRVAAGDVDALREALGRLAADADLRERMGARSLELAQRFTPDAWADVVAALAERLHGR